MNFRNPIPDRKRRASISTGGQSPRYSPGRIAAVIKGIEFETETIMECHLDSSGSAPTETDPGTECPEWRRDTPVGGEWRVLGIAGVRRCAPRCRSPSNGDIHPTTRLPLVATLPSGGPVGWLRTVASERSRSASWSGRRCVAVRAQRPGEGDSRIRPAPLEPFSDRNEYHPGRCRPAVTNR